VSNIEEFRALYERKVAAGLVDVKFDLTDAGKAASLEDVAGEVLAMEAAIQAGKVRPLDFGDLTLTDAQVDEIKAAILEDYRL
jgi:hypothetical protein